MRSTAALKRLLPEYPDLVLNNRSSTLEYSSIAAPSRIPAFGLLTLANHLQLYGTQDLWLCSAGADASSMSTPHTALEEKM